MYFFGAYLAVVAVLLVVMYYQLETEQPIE